MNYTLWCNQIGTVWKRIRQFLNLAICEMKIENENLSFYREIRRRKIYLVELLLIPLHSLHLLKARIPVVWGTQKKTFPPTYIPFLKSKGKFCPFLSFSSNSIVYSKRKALHWFFLLAFFNIFEKFGMLPLIMYKLVTFLIQSRELAES